MNTQIKLLDVVTLLKTSELGLCRGQVGTIVEEYEPGSFEVEFSDTSGRALETLGTDQLMTSLSDWRKMLVQTKTTPPQGKFKA